MRFPNPLVVLYNHGVLVGPFLFASAVESTSIINALALEREFFLQRVLYHGIADVKAIKKQPIGSLMSASLSGASFSKPSRRFQQKRVAERAPRLGVPCPKDGAG